ncbi:recombinase family protein, partial [Mucilaginibacter pineti]|uniref:hypothetical protein n=1 Tax=Mucilaginibacter pineti TaxID=1391627 RepID=UPI0019681DF3
MNREAKKSENKKAVLYCRVSTKEQAEEGNSLVTQERVCREYAARVEIPLKLTTPFRFKVTTRSGFKLTTPFRSKLT